jgi:sugar phosphate isomerase/epimerase
VHPKIDIRHYCNLLALEGLRGLGTSFAELAATVAEAGYQGIQFVAPLTGAQDAACRAYKLGRCSSGRVNLPEEAALLAERCHGEGMECVTLHMGWGLENDSEAHALIEAVLEAVQRWKIPLFVETHRATIFQDMWRTVQFVKCFPELRFNGDFSHWYTGQEMVYGGFERKLAFIQPVIERVRFIHGRIGNPGHIHSQNLTCSIS